MTSLAVASAGSQTMTQPCEQGNPSKFPEMRRVEESWVAVEEKRALLWLAARTPPWIGPDHMTALGLAAQIGAGTCYALSRWNRYALFGVIAAWR
jgi:hypothetical protein